MASSDSSIKHSNVDVLIIGAGPAGLMAANWFAAQGLGTTTRIVDKRNDKIFTGQADGLQCRTLEVSGEKVPSTHICMLAVSAEKGPSTRTCQQFLPKRKHRADTPFPLASQVFNSFGFADRAWKESNHMLEICFWNPDENGKLTRTGRIPDTIPGISRWQQVVLHQGRIERFFLDTIKKNSGDTLHVERGVLPEVLEIDESRVQDDSPDNYPITVQLRQLSEEEATPAQFGKSTPNGLFRSSISGDDTPQGIRTDVAAGTREIVHAKYVIGCDGAHSWVRRNLGFKME